MEGNNALISIIIPVFNTKDYLEKCLDSVIEQTYKNLEVILVDDGSTDGSELIVDKYKNFDSRVIVIHQSNAGESAARNVGLKHANGEYIGFMDCDDWVDVHMYEDLLKLAVEYDADVVTSGWINEENGASTVIKNKKTVDHIELNRDEILYYVYCRDEYREFAYMWDKLYKREILIDDSKGAITFDEGLTLGGDVLFLGEALLRVNKAVYCSNAYYHYRQRENSGCHTTNLAKRIYWIIAYEKLINEFEKAEIKDEIMIWVKRFMAYQSSNLAELAIEQKNRETYNYATSVMKEYKEIYEKTNLDYPDRIIRYFAILEKEV